MFTGHLSKFEFCIRNFKIMKFFYRLLLNILVCLLFALIRVCTKDNSTIDDNINKIISIDNECINLKPESYICELNYSCIYGQILNATCEIIMDSKCHVSFRLNFYI